MRQMLDSKERIAMLHGGARNLKRKKRDWALPQELQKEAYAPPKPQNWRGSAMGISAHSPVARVAKEICQKLTIPIRMSRQQDGRPSSKTVRCPKGQQINNFRHTGCDCNMRQFGRYGAQP